MEAVQEHMLPQSETYMLGSGLMNTAHDYSYLYPKVLYSQAPNDVQSSIRQVKIS